MRASYSIVSARPLDNPKCPPTFAFLVIVMSLSLSLYVPTYYLYVTVLYSIVSPSFPPYPLPIARLVVSRGESGPQPLGKSFSLLFDPSSKFNFQCPVIIIPPALPCLALPLSVALLPLGSSRGDGGFMPSEWHPIKSK